MNALLFVSGACLVAGAMNALAGGGSFVSLPALIAVGVPSVQANASSTVALFPGGVASAWAYRDGLGPVGAVSLRALLVTTLIGGVVGAILLLSTPTQTFDFVLPWLLLVACLALGFGRVIGEWLRRRWRIPPAAVLAIQFGLGIYGGYFGDAVGIMMMAVWGLLDSRDLKSLNAPRTRWRCSPSSSRTPCAGRRLWPCSVARSSAAMAAPTSAAAPRRTSCAWGRCYSRQGSRSRSSCGHTRRIKRWRAAAGDDEHYVYAIAL
jgi:uncharacterized protein